MSSEHIIEVISYDPGAIEDIPAWCRLQGHLLLSHINYGKRNHYYIQKK
jgi:tRNA 2-thiouridine synthesizing protein A